MLWRLTVDVIPATGKTPALGSINTHGTSTNKQSFLEDMHVKQHRSKAFLVYFVRQYQEKSQLRQISFCSDTRLALNLVTPLAWRLCMAEPIAVPVPCWAYHGHMLREVTTLSDLCLDTKLALNLVTRLAWVKTWSLIKCVVGHAPPLLFFLSLCAPGIYLTKWNKVAVLCDESVYMLKMKMYSSNSASYVKIRDGMSV